jgi:hypothetical protein
MKRDDDLEDLGVNGRDIKQQVVHWVRQPDGSVQRWVLLNPETNFPVKFRRTIFN